MKIPARYVLLRVAAYEPVVHRHRPAPELTTWCGLTKLDRRGWAVADAANLNPSLRLCRRCYPEANRG